MLNIDVKYEVKRILCIEHMKSASKRNLKR